MNTVCPGRVSGGAVFRRTVLAMVITLVLYVVLAMATATAIGPHYAAPVTVASASATNGSRWVIRNFVQAPNGQELSQDAFTARSGNCLPASRTRPTPARSATG